MDTLKKAAFVAVIGRPSVGKSTLVNLLCGQKVAIVSAVPQTTRNAIRGIVNRPEGQLVFVDTPGRHASEKKLNKKLIEVGDRAIGESDLILYVLDASRLPGPEEDAIAAVLAPMAERTAAAVNKADLPGADVAGTRDYLTRTLPSLPPERCVTVSALEKTGAEELLSLLFSMAPQGDALYPDEYYTDQDVRFRIAEIIREKAINRLRQELPHSLYVDVADAELKDNDTRLWVRAFIIVERESQKGMVVGKDGRMIKAIRVAAQKDLDSIFEWKIDLDLRVKTSRDWRHNDGLLRRLVDR
ncbi:GTPase Era [Breznakiella homolactica]|uniref:GTPase Era n=1 Tax=Breznakiella homolactica TaxID=2798577 RepID=A0A7T8BAN8_9SPIR|nr:GTPase Era [Breznakiella homolactica]QQO09200.1 GTPase Era [Breznakiella homolactica]